MTAIDRRNGSTRTGKRPAPGEHTLRRAPGRSILIRPECRNRGPGADHRTTRRLLVRPDLGPGAPGLRPGHRRDAQSPRRRPEKPCVPGIGARCGRRERPAARSIPQPMPAQLLVLPAVAPVVSALLRAGHPLAAARDSRGARRCGRVLGAALLELRPRGHGEAAAGIRGTEAVGRRPGQPVVRRHPTPRGQRPDRRSRPGANSARARCPHPAVQCTVRRRRHVRRHRVGMASLPRTRRPDRRSRRHPAQRRARIRRREHVAVLDRRAGPGVLAAPLQHRPLLGGPRSRRRPHRLGRHLVRFPHHARRDGPGERRRMR